MEIDDEPEQRHQRIVFGSLDAAEIRASANVVPSISSLDTMELSKESTEARERRLKLMKQMEMKRREREVVVPTTDVDVKSMLRKLQHPITLFGEGPYERRARLKKLLVEGEAAGTLPHDLMASEGPKSTSASQVADQSRFFTEGSEDLKTARICMTHFSFARSQARVETQKARCIFDSEKSRAERDSTRKSAAADIRRFADHGSQVGGDRPNHCCSINPDGKSVLTGSWDMIIRQWSLPQCTKMKTFKGHIDRVTGVAWHPDDSSVVFASCSADSTVRLWNTETEDCSETVKFEGHNERASCVRFHPCGKFLGSTSFDRTWRLWDVEKQICLAEQTGHTAPVYCLDFHADGSLACTCDLSGLLRVWDMRSGRGLLVLEGHVKQALSCSFSPNGYHLASSSDDNTCKIWDLRKKSILYTIAAHSNLVSCAKYEPSAGSFIATSSYDETVKLWDAHNFRLIRTLHGHGSRVMRLDISKDAQTMVTVNFDRTWKLWQKGDTCGAPDSTDANDSIKEIDMETSALVSSSDRVVVAEDDDE